VTARARTLAERTTRWVTLQPEIIERLCLGETQRSICRRLKVDRAALGRRVDSPEWQRQISARRSEIIRELREEFWGLLPEAVACYRKAMQEGGAAGTRAAHDLLVQGGFLSPPGERPQGREKEAEKIHDVYFVHPAELPRAALPGPAGPAAAGVSDGNHAQSDAGTGGNPPVPSANDGAGGGTPVGQELHRQKLDHQGRE
jgi:hypothetical protein